ncbi:hypothetical protein PoB_001492500 [Plakobranchus ocellatus]|uniref:Uncharacterized protein n=1 Tax=Plakobranchus ocellatus TaxID=259542 RepID=A0AAV3Z192_9GAST|nr:hypothetical protein PoB_001492500 [Plakobranchus ocellatus]
MEDKENKVNKSHWEVDIWVTTDWSIINETDRQTRSTDRQAETLHTDSRVRLAAARNTLESVWREPCPRQSYFSHSGGRQTDFKVILRPPGRLQSVFGGRYRDSRVFLAAAMLTLESFWGIVVLACYTGIHKGQEVNGLF